jgi:preprotein translocase subunit SecG
MFLQKLTVILISILPLIIVIVEYILERQKYRRELSIPPNIKKEKRHF